MADAPTLDVPEGFALAVAAIYGDAADPREVWLSKMMTPGTSDVHIDGDGSQNSRRKLGGAMLVGSAAESAALARATQSARRTLGSDETVIAPKVKTLRALKGVRPKLKALGESKAGAAAELGLQAANFGIGLAGAHALLAKPKQPVSKAIKLKPLNPGMAPRIGGLRARRVVAKAGIYRSARTVAQNAAKTSEHAERAARDAADTAAKVKRLVPKRRTVALGATGTVGTLGGATYAGAYEGTKRHQLVKADLTISKVDTDQHLVFGWASVSQLGGQDVIDLQGDYVPIEEIEKSAYEYVLECRKGGDMHERVAKALTTNWTQPKHTADLVESMVFTPEKYQALGIDPAGMPVGWFLGFKVNDEEQWSLVKSGGRTGFSVHGTGRREPLAKARHATEAATAGSAAAAAGSYAGAHAARRSARQNWQRYTVTRDAEEKLGQSPAISGQFLDRAVGGAAKAVRLRRVGRAGALVTAVGAGALTEQRRRLHKVATLRERASQAAHPPAVKLHPVDSSAIESMGYQPQTRRLAVRFKHGKDYTYRAAPATAAKVLESKSKGQAYNALVRDKLPHKTKVNPADRARLFVGPVGKSAAAVALDTTADVLTAGARMSGAAKPPSTSKPKTIKPIVTPAVKQMAAPKPLGLPVNSVPAPKPPPNPVTS